jgi:hypothetical protein
MCQKLGTTTVPKSDARRRSRTQSELDGEHYADSQMLTSERLDA